MKKSLLICGALAMLGACDGNKYAQYDSLEDFKSCERIETTAEHLVYKCPASIQWFQDLKSLEPNGMFMTGDDLPLGEMWADTEHAYAEVALNDAGTCEDGFSIRAMTREPKTDANWAFVTCYGNPTPDLSQN